MYVARVPEGCSAKRGHLTVKERYLIIVPEGIAKVEKALLCYDITAFLKCALAVCLTVKFTFSDGHSIAFIQCALLVEALIFDHFH